MINLSSIGLAWYFSSDNVYLFNKLPGDDRVEKKVKTITDKHRVSNVQTMNTHRNQLSMKN